MGCSTSWPASWDTYGVCDHLRDYVIGALGDADGLLVVDETWMSHDS